jgi:RNA polymerase sigma-70 factor (ECF subfamily)
MSSRASDNVLRELALLVALDSVKARTDTSAIAEIQDWSGAVIGKFYGASVEQELPTANRPSESLTIAGPMVAGSGPSYAKHAAYAGGNYAQATASQLIPICLSTNDEAAWREFVRRFGPLINSVIAKAVLRYGNTSRTLIDDLVQDVFVKLFASGSRILKSINVENEQVLFGFFKVIAANVVHDHFSSMARTRSSGPEREHVALEDSFAQLNRDAGTSKPSTTIEGDVLIQEIDRLLQMNSQAPTFERDYKIFWLYYRDGLTAQAISNLPGLGLSSRGVERVLHLMKRQIRQRLFSPGSEKKP